MARRRTQWPEFWTSEEMLSLSKDEHRSYGRLMAEADDGGRVSLSPVLLKSWAFSVYADTIKDCLGYIEALVSAGHVASYDVDGKRYGLILGFSAHQKPNCDKVRPGGSWNPAPPEDMALGCADYCWGVQRIVEHVAAKRPKQLAEMVATLWPYGCDIPPTRLADVRHAEFTGMPCGYHMDTTGIPNGSTADSADSADSVSSTPCKSPKGDVGRSGTETGTDEDKPKKKRAKVSGPDAPIELPAWVPEEWAAFDDMRRRGKARASWTTRAQQMAVKTLERMVANGYDARLIIERTVASGWQSFNEHESCRRRVTHPTHQRVERGRDVEPTRKATREELAALTGAIGGGE